MTCVKCGSNKIVAKGDGYRCRVCKYQTPVKSVAGVSTGLWADIETDMGSGYRRLPKLEVNQ